MKFTSLLRLFDRDSLRTAPKRHNRHTRRGRLGQLRPAELVVESLEERNLLSVLPPPVVPNSVITLDANDREQQNSPIVTIDPVNPQHAVVVWAENVYDPPALPEDQGFSRVQGAYSTNGGASWSLFNISNQSGEQSTDPMAAFNRNGQFYVSWANHRKDNISGNIRVNKYSFGSSPSFLNSSIVYEWDGGGGGQANSDPAQPRPSRRQQPPVVHRPADRRHPDRPLVRQRLCRLEHQLRRPDLL